MYNRIGRQAGRYFINPVREIIEIIVNNMSIICFCYRKEMGKWTFHLSVVLGLLVILLISCYAEGEELFFHIIEYGVFEGLHYRLNWLVMFFISNFIYQMIIRYSFKVCSVLLQAF